MNSYESLVNVEVWSENEFGKSKLGNKARVHRLVLMARTAADQPAGRITQVFKTSAEREGAYKFLENPKIDSDAIALATHVACAERCAAEAFVFVPVDGSSLSLSDPKQTRGGLGPVGNRSKKGRGLEVMNAIAVRKDGTPLGMLGQAFWARDEKKNPQPSRKRPLEEKETRFWFAAINQTIEAFVIAQNDCQPWFQLDRGGDFRELLGWAAETEVLTTVRATHNRRIIDADTKYIWETIEATPVMGRYTLEVSAGPRRKKRQAQMEVRTCPVTLRLPHFLTGRNKLMTLHVVQTREIGTTPAGEKPIEWTLLTTFNVQTFEHACVVIYGYAQRWRVEEFHKTWKSTCGIEDTLLEEASRVIKWSVIMSAIAMRIERLKYFARKSPNQPATEEFTRNEIDAAIILRAPDGYTLGDTPPISLVVRWVADIGGYTGKSSGGPPGSIVIGRGLKEIASWAKHLTKLKVKLVGNTQKK